MSHQQMPTCQGLAFEGSRIHGRNRKSAVCVEISRWRIFQDCVGQARRLELRSCTTGPSGLMRYGADLQKPGTRKVNPLRDPNPCLWPPNS